MRSVVVDNTSPDILYSQGWLDVPGRETDYNQTLAYSDEPESSFRFTFTGKSISVFGCLRPGTNAIATYTLDNLPPTVFMAANSWQYVSRRPFYTSPTMPDGTHTLVVTAKDASYCFDYVLYDPGANPVGATAIAMASAEGPRGGLHRRLRALLPLSGVFALLVLLVAAFVVRRRRRSRRRAADDAEIPYVPNVPYAPSRLPAMPEKVRSLDGMPLILYPDSTDAPPVYVA